MVRTIRRHLVEEAAFIAHLRGEQEWAVPSKIRKEREGVPRKEIVRLEDNEMAWDSTLRPEGDGEVDDIVSSML